ncbi:MAG TPA: TIGR02221 family CRISPR-associated protein [Candidatus Competibacteraceae bacterium]|nr:TIGR02221 family CRISPR-associated protein [Candidatus Competibacteraceae bacterium]HSA45319.1 TIGR02221 family CRISPR-associated protein [Candidatus Competibacteraceae bacterium]
MSHTLVTFLGRAGNYQSTTYRFPDGETATTRYFGLALRRKLQADRLVMFGTSSSAWDVICLDDEGAALTGEALDAVEQVQNAVQANRVTKELLDPLAEPISRRLGFEVCFRVIGYADQMGEQLKLLQAMAAEVKAGDRVSLDITHSFRHLPMLALLSALHLREARQVTVEGLYYGAFEMKQEGIAPVMNLAGLLRIADWVAALNTFDKDGDYGAFVDLMEKDGVSTHQANYLRRATFRERTSNAWEARADLRNFDAVLDSGLPGVSDLFADQLKARIRWHKGQDLLACQRELAIEYLEHRDYIRATIYAFEGFVTSLIDDEKHERFWDFQDRDRARKEYQSGLRGKKSLLSDYFLLKALRNALAHGTRPDDEKIKQKVERVLSDPKLLQEELRCLIKKLLPL